MKSQNSVLPIDFSFLSNTIYEGFLRYKASNFSFKNSFKLIKELNKEIRIEITPNDQVLFINLLSYLNLLSALFLQKFSSYNHIILMYNEKDKFSEQLNKQISKITIIKSYSYKNFKKVENEEFNKHINEILKKINEDIKNLKGQIALIIAGKTKEIKEINKVIENYDKLKNIKKFSLKDILRKDILSQLFNLSQPFLELLVNANQLDNLKINEENHFVMNIKNKKISIGISNRNLTGFQIFKVDRYTGLTGLETKFTSEQLTLNIALETTLLGILGLFSSFIKFAKDDNKYYFLFFSPTEVLDLYNSSQEKLKIYFNIKDQIVNELKELLTKTTVLEVILTELLLNLKILNLLENYNIDKISLLLFKIEKEGYTYKIYEQTSFDIYKFSVIDKLIYKYFKKSGKFLKFINKRIISPKAFPIKRLSNRNNDEFNNLINAFNSLYQFISLGNMQQWYIFIRELTNCYEKTKREEYKKIISKLSFF